MELFIHNNWIEDPRWELWHKTAGEPERGRARFHLVDATGMYAAVYNKNQIKRTECFFDPRRTPGLINTKMIIDHPLAVQCVPTWNNYDGIDGTCTYLKFFTNWGWRYPGEVGWRPHEVEMPKSWQVEFYLDSQGEYLNATPNIGWHATRFLYPYYIQQTRPFYYDNIDNIEILLQITTYPRLLDFLGKTTSWWIEHHQGPCEPDHFAPDYRIDMREIGTVARSVGHRNPEIYGSGVWEQIDEDFCDINMDGRVDMKDVALISRLNGWVGSPAWWWVM